MKYWGAVVVVILFAMPATAAMYGGDEVPILYVPISARATALGNSLYCSEDEGLRYNPAYLGNLSHNYFYATYGLFLRETKFGGLAMQVRTGVTGWALGYSSIQSSFDNYVGPDNDRVGSVSAEQSLFSIAAGIGGFGEDFFAGTALRVVTDTVENAANSGYSADIGAGYLFGPALRAGLVLKNIVSSPGSSEDRIVQSVILAGAWNPGLRWFGQAGSENSSLTAAVVKSNSLDPVFSLGWEMPVSNRFAVRLGWDRDYPVAGFGFTRQMFNLDIAAAFKEQGLLYFMTLGWSFGSGPAGQAQAGVPPEPVQAARQATPPIPEKPRVDPEQGKQARGEELVQEGWSRLRENRLQEAYHMFTAALKFIPEYPPALYGQQMARKELERTQRKTALNRYIAQGRDALKNGDYLQAHKAFRTALDADPENDMAKEGIRLTVEYTAREIGENLKSATGRASEFVPLSLNDAMDISAGGTFANLVAALRHLSGRRYQEGYVEWRKVQPRNSLEKYDASFQAVFTGERDRILAKATQLTNNGVYAAAVAELQKAVQLPDLPAEDVRRIRALISSYEYVGKSIASNNLSNAEALRRQRQYRSAARCLERVIQCGYDVDRARSMLREIEGREDEAGAQNPAQKAVPVQETAPVAPEKTEGASPPSPPSGGSAAPGVPENGRQRNRSAMNPALKGRLLKEYRRKVSELSVQNRIKECREYLLRILYLEPNDADAKRLLERVNRLLKTRGE